MCKGVSLMHKCVVPAEWYSRSWQAFFSMQLFEVRFCCALRANLVCNTHRSRSFADSFLSIFHLQQMTIWREYGYSTIVSGRHFRLEFIFLKTQKNEIVVMVRDEMTTIRLFLICEILVCIWHLLRRWRCELPIERFLDTFFFHSNSLAAKSEC